MKRRTDVQFQVFFFSEQKCNISCRDLEVCLHLEQFHWLDLILSHFPCCSKHARKENYQAVVASDVNPPTVALTIFVISGAYLRWCCCTRRNIHLHIHQHHSKTFRWQHGTFRTFLHSLLLVSSSTLLVLRKPVTLPACVLYKPNPPKPLGRIWNIFVPVKGRFAADTSATTSFYLSWCPCPSGFC